MAIAGTKSSVSYSPSKGKANIDAAIAGSGAKTKLVNGERVDINTGQAYTPTSNIPTINSSALADQQAFKLPPTTFNSPQMSSLGGFIESQTDSFTKNLETQVANRQASTEDSLSKLADTFASQLTPTEATIKAEKQVGLSDVETELNDINQQIRAEQQAFRRAAEAIQNEAGLTKGQASQRIAELERKSISKQADLYVIQQGVQGKYDSAKAAADRAVQAIIESQQQELDYRQFIYNENKELFSTSEARLFETQQADRNRALDREEQKLNDIKNIGLLYLQEGGSPSVAQQIMNVDTVGEAYALTGGVIGQNARITAAINSMKYQEMLDELNNPSTNLTTDERETIAKLDQSKAAQAQIDLVTNLNELYGLVKEYGSVNPTDPTAKGRIQSLRSQLLVDIAVAGGQGAIQGDEADRYAQIIGDGWLETDTKVLNGIAQAITTTNGKIQSNLNYIEATVPGAKAGFQPFSTYIEEIDASTYLDEALGESLFVTDEDAIAAYRKNLSWTKK